MSRSLPPYPIFSNALQSMFIYAFLYNSLFRKLHTNFQLLRASLRWREITLILKEKRLIMHDSEKDQAYGTIMSPQC